MWRRFGYRIACLVCHDAWRLNHRRLMGGTTLSLATILTALVLVSCADRQTNGESVVLPQAVSVDTIQATDTPSTTIQASPTPPPTRIQLTPVVVNPGEAIAAELTIEAEDIQLFPVPKIINGDRVTFKVSPSVPKAIAVEDVSVDIFVNESLVGSGYLDARNLAGEGVGVFEWIWDTSGYPGTHQVRVVLDQADTIQIGDDDAEDNQVEIAVRVGKSKERPLEERDASWYSAETDCCTVHAITRTAAYRDFPELLSIVDAAISKASSRIDEYPEGKINLYFIDRTVGQGGYAGSDMVIVYNDRAYFGGEISELITHEAVHTIDRQFAPQRIKILAEGVAVWAAGGHYWPQDLQLRTAALLAMNKYIPLATLANDFYPAQHEIGYLEAGAFVDYLVSRFGWARVRAFYSDTAATDGLTESEALDSNLEKHFEQSLSEMEAAWLAELQTLAPPPEEIEDLRTMIRYFEIARQYQQQYDPAAYFLTAWLPHPEDVISRGNIADYLRQPDSETNLAVEILLRSCYDAMRQANYDRANVILDSLERFLNPSATTIDPLVRSYLDIVHTAVAFGYEPQRITMEGDLAKVVATTASGNRLLNLDLELQANDWILTAN